MSQLHHIALGACDVRRVAAFYREAFSLVELDRHLDEKGDLRSIWLEIDSAILMIEKTTDKPRPIDGVGAGPFLLAFSVDTDKKSALEARLNSLGAPIEDRSDFSSYTRDPEGNRVAISHYPTVDSCSTSEPQ